jgi:phage repressor protein C with HTH and peptisase S24 domain
MYDNATSAAKPVMYDFRMYIDWIKRGLQKKGKTQIGLAKALGVAHPQITRLLQSHRRLKADEIPKIAEYLEEPPPARAIPIVGYIGAGAEVLPFDDFQSSEGLDAVPAPPDFTDGIALSVRGDSMWPKYEDGDIVLCESLEIDPTSLLNSYCYVQLTDGRTFLKILRKGSAPGLYTLASHNAPSIEDVTLARVYRIAWAKPNHRRK